MALPLRLGRDPLNDAAASFEALLLARLDRAYRLATVILGSAIEAEDAVADASLVAWRARGRLREPERFDAWFERIVVNTCRDRLRARRRRPVDVVVPSDLGDRPGRGPDFRDVVHAREAMSRAFERLSPDDRIVLALRFWQDQTVEAIADRLGIPAGTVKSRLHHATARLRAALADAEVER